MIARLIRYSLVFVLLSASAVLTGCSSFVQKPIDLDAQFWNDKDPVIGVALSPLPAPQLALTGNQGLLELAINKGVNSKLSDQVSAWELHDLESLPDEVVASLKAKGLNAKRIPDAIDLTKFKETEKREGYLARNISDLKSKYGVDRVLLISYTTTGAFRSYYSVVPTSVPTPQVGGIGMLVDPKDSRLVWYKPFVVVQPAQCEWDQPGYSNLSNAFYQALDGSRQQILSAFNK